MITECLGTTKGFLGPGLGLASSGWGSHYGLRVQDLGFRIQGLGFKA